MNTRHKSQTGSTGDAQTTRRCLLCNREFASEWIGNRICKRCKSSANWRSGP